MKDKEPGQLDLRAVIIGCCLLAFIIAALWFAANHSYRGPLPGEQPMIPKKVAHAR